MQCPKGSDLAQLSNPKLLVYETMTVGDIQQLMRAKLAEMEVPKIF